MHSAKIAIKIHDEKSGEKIKVKLRVFVPKWQHLEYAMKDYLALFQPMEHLFILKMIKFHLMFANDDLIRAESFDLKKLFDSGFIRDIETVFEKKHTKNSNDRTVERLLPKALYYSPNCILRFPEEAYINFRQLILDELVAIEQQIDQLANDTRDSIIKKLSFYKKLKYRYFNKNGIDATLNKAKRKAFKLVLNSAKKIESDISSKDFANRAELLLKSFDKEEYRNLIKDVIDYLSSSYNNKGDEYYDEQIEHLKESIENDNQVDSLVWIVENMISHADAFDIMRIEAENIFYDFLGWYFRKKYRQFRGKMTIAERRMFQLLFFRRKSFEYRFIFSEPLFTNFVFNSDDITKALLILVLLLKKGRFGEENLNKELLTRWQSYLRIYPKLVDKHLKSIEVLNDKEKLAEILNRICTDNEIQIVKLYLKGIDPELISIKTNMKLKNMIKLMSAVTRKIKKEVDKDVQEN